MSQSQNNLGDPPALTDFASVIQRAEHRAGSRAELTRITGFSEQNLRRWGDQGKYPGLKPLYAARRDLPADMLIDFLTWYCRGLRVQIVLACDGEGEVQVIAGSLTKQALAAQASMLELTQGVNDAEADGRIDASEASNIAALADVQIHWVRQIAHQAMVATTARAARRMG